MLTNFECTVLKSNLFSFARYYVSVYWAGTNSEFFLRTLFIFGLKSITHTHTHTHTHTKSWVSEQTPSGVFDPHDPLVFGEAENFLGEKVHRAT